MSDLQGTRFEMRGKDREYKEAEKTLIVIIMINKYIIQNERSIQDGRG